MTKEDILKRLDGFQEQYKSKPPCVIIYKGSPLTVPSGKSSWRNVGAAKNALNLAMNFYMGKIEGMTPATYLEKEGIVEFKTFDL